MSGPQIRGYAFACLAAVRNRNTVSYSIQIDKPLKSPGGMDRVLWGSRYRGRVRATGFLGGDHDEKAEAIR
jgi:hypothetical protein